MDEQRTGPRAWHRTRSARRRRRRHGRPPARRGAARPRRRRAPGRSTCSPRSRAPPYDRVALTSYFSGRDPEDLLLGEPELLATARRHGCTATQPSQRIDTERARRSHARGRVVRRTTRWCSPPAPRRSCRRCPAATCPGCFVYRTVDDVAALRAWVDAARNLRAAASAAPSSAAGCSGSRRPARCRRSASRPRSSSSRRG